jgi:FixJ family two-component response regulator
MMTNSGRRASVVVVVDDDEPIRMAYARALRSEGYVTYPVGGLAEFKQLALTGQLAGVDVCVLLDMDLSGATGLDVYDWLLEQKMAAGVVFISGQSSAKQIIDAFRQGAVDFLLKPATLPDLLGAVRRVLDRDLHLPHELPPGFGGMTQQEARVLLAVVRGSNSKDIANLLGVTERTIKMHRTNIMRKVGVDSATQLVSLFFTRLAEMPQASRARISLDQQSD